MEERCERTDLPVSGCYHCRADTVVIRQHGTPEPVRNAIVVSTRARWNSTCPECKGTVVKGEMIYKATEPGSWVCSECVE
jgi:hypothetical protein